MRGGEADRPQGCQGTVKRSDHHAPLGAVARPGPLGRARHTGFIDLSLSLVFLSRLYWPFRTRLAGSGQGRAEGFHAWGPPLAALLFALAALHAAWGVWQASRLSSDVPPKVQVALAVPLQAGPDLAFIAERHLFGLPPEASEAQQAPPTRANLVLGGTWYVAGGAGAYALVGEVGGSQRPYRPGDRLPGGMELVEIQADRVLLRRDGRSETLLLPRASSTATAPPAQANPLLRRYR